MRLHISASPITLSSAALQPSWEFVRSEMGLLFVSRKHFGNTLPTVATMERLLPQSSPVWTWSLPQGLRKLLRGVLVVGLAMLLILLTHSAQASEISRASRLEIPVALSPVSAPSASLAPSWLDLLPLLGARLRCSGSSSRPKLRTVRPCSDVFDAELAPATGFADLKLFP